MAKVDFTVNELAFLMAAIEDSSGLERIVTNPANRPARAKIEKALKVTTPDWSHTVYGKTRERNALTVVSSDGE